MSGTLYASGAPGERVSWFGTEWSAEQQKLRDPALVTIEWTGEPFDAVVSTDGTALEPRPLPLTEVKLVARRAAEDYRDRPRSTGASFQPRTPTMS